MRSLFHFFFYFNDNIFLKASTQRTKNITYGRVTTNEKSLLKGNWNVNTIIYLKKISYHVCVICDSDRQNGTRCSKKRNREKKSQRRVKCFLITRFFFVKKSDILMYTLKMKIISLKWLLQMHFIPNTQYQLFFSDISFKIFKKASI